MESNTKSNKYNIQKELNRQVWTYRLKGWWLSMMLSNIRDLLLTVTLNTFHYEATKKPDKYIVWAEDGQSSSSFSDNKMTDQAIQGTIDYFTTEEFDTNFELIQEKLNSIELSWKLSSIQREPITKYIHYEWVWEVNNTVG